MSSSQIPAQGYKSSGLGVAGGGSDGTKQQDTTSTLPGGAGRPNETGPAQDVAGTLPTNFSLGATKADSKGGDHDDPPQSHEIDDVIAHDPSAAPQTNEGSRPPNAQK